MVFMFQIATPDSASRGSDCESTLFQPPVAQSVQEEEGWEWVSART